MAKTKSRLKPTRGRIVVSAFSHDSKKRKMFAVVRLNSVGLDPP